ncbi:MAG: TatD family hydrolase [candidate division WOR-3 bacterium]|nr:TatD family hydrolase [candidate division WOR-3 bacterium]MCX7756996.1 TatD family hydrolase [candidate division WOR-3 bacterium]MDW7987833.1 TatD family hydrolase [candidate division WOR-3 bacterium]
MELFDSHCHLTDPAYKNRHEEIITRAQANNVKYFLTVGLNVTDSKLAVKTAENFSGVFCSIGIHPHDTDNATENDIKELEKLACHKKVKAIGETGLDFYRNYSTHQNQEKFFNLQIELAKQLDLPLVIHIRNAYLEAKSILLKHQYFRGVIHCYSGDESFAHWAISQGFFISFTGVITYHNFRSQNLIKKIPKNHLLIETDAPYLSPEPMRGKVNEPAFIKYTAYALAKIKETSYEDICYFTTQNALMLFNIS